MDELPHMSALCRGGSSCLPSLTMGNQGRRDTAAAVPYNRTAHSILRRSDYPSLVPRSSEGTKPATLLVTLSAHAEEAALTPALPFLRLAQRH